MRILITGIAGFLGSHLADRLLSIGHEIVGVDNMVGGEPGHVAKDVEFHNADCGDIDRMVEYSKGCDAVFHAACTAYDGLSVFSPSFVTRNTFQISMSTLSAALKNNVARFVYCSSMSRYGNNPSLPFTEDLDCHPVNPYGIAKYASEQVVSQLCPLMGAEYVIVVPHNIIGPRQKYDDPYRNVAAIMINRLLQGKPPIIYGDGNQKRCFSFVQDVIDCLVEALTRDGVSGEVFNVGPDEEFITINQIAQMIGEIMAKDVEPIYMPERPCEVKLATCSADKARERLGYCTKTSLREGLRSMVEYISQLGPKPFMYNLPVEIGNDLTPPTWKDRLI